MCMGAEKNKKIQFYLQIGRGVFMGHLRISFFGQSHRNYMMGLNNLQNVI